jgi:hypothetical protein
MVCFPLINIEAVNLLSLVVPNISSITPYSWDVFTSRFSFSGAGSKGFTSGENGNCTGVAQGRGDEKRRRRSRRTRVILGDEDEQRAQAPSTADNSFNNRSQSSGCTVV